MATYRCKVCESFNVVDPKSRNPVCTACDARLDTSGNPQEVDADALTRAIEKSPVPLFVDFWAPWCGPCVMAAPIVKALGQHLAGEVVVLKVDTQDSPEASERHDIYGIPTFAMFSGGEEIARQMGLLPRGALEVWARQTLQTTPAAATAVSMPSA